MIMMVTNNNNKALDLYNGDTGMTVKINDDSTLYFMVKRTSSLYTRGYEKDKIFTNGEYLFYPLRLLKQNEMTLAYAITIHKSQGSDYNNIFVILPQKKGHPLLNRQIVYTAITRTKGNTYIYSNMERLNEAKRNKDLRDTKIFM